MSKIETLEATLGTLSTALSWAIAAIIIGLILELPEYSKKLKERVPHWCIPLGAALVIVGIAAELGLHIWSDQVSDEVRAIQKEEIIALQKKLAPRTLTKPQYDSLAEFSKQNPDIRFAISAVTEEPIVLAQTLADALKAGNWQWVDWPYGGIGTKLPASNNRVVGHIVLSGIEVASPNARLLPISHALVDALTAAGLEKVRISPAPGVIADQNAPMIIMIGQKP